MTGKRETPPPTATLSKEASWVAEMREHRLETGSYRRSDVRRVLGSPWDRVDIKPTDTKSGSATLVSIKR